MVKALVRRRGSIPEAARPAPMPYTSAGDKLIDFTRNQRLFCM
jgi:molybdenum-dependent DNA-binding transcriptional regulator ModE